MCYQEMLLGWLQYFKIMKEMDYFRWILFFVVLGLIVVYDEEECWELMSSE